MNDESPLTIAPELLAAYADGELDAVTRLRVERYLADHPEAAGELQDQEHLSRVNDEYWRLVSPPMPTKQQWDDALERIAKAVPAAPIVWRPLRFVGPAAALIGMAAALLIAVVAIDRNRPHATNHPPVFVDKHQPGHLTSVNEEEDFLYEVARADDVEIIQLPEAAAALVVVGRHPIADVPVILASAGELQVLNYGPDDQGNLPDLDSTLGPDAPIMWAPPLKP